MVVFVIEVRLKILIAGVLGPVAPREVNFYRGEGEALVLTRLESGKRARGFSGADKVPEAQPFTRKR